MNGSRSLGMGELKILHILTELSENNSLTQRDLSSRLGIALGLVNSYIKNLISRGYVKVTSIPPRRYAYYLTPKGFAEKTRLTYHLLQNYTRVYREARVHLKKLFNELQASGIRKVVFAGADEVTEIAYLTLQETALELVGIVDDDKAGKKFFGQEIVPLRDIGSILHDSVVVTSYGKSKMIYEELIECGANKRDVKVLFS